MKIDKTNCIPTRTCESYLVNAADDQNNPNCTSLKLPMNLIDSKSSNVITRCTRQYPRRARMKLTKYQIKEARWRRRPEGSGAPPCVCHNNPTIHMFISLLAISYQCRAYFKRQGYICTPRAWLSSLQLWTSRQKTRISIIQRGLEAASAATRYLAIGST